MHGALNHNQAEGVNAGVAYDYLMKFDDAFFAIERITGNVGDKLLYGAKPDKTGWNHQDKRPDESGYDDEMLQATADDLIFFTSLEELKQEGYICVAVLHEVRGVKNAASVGFSTNVFGHMKSDVQLVDHVFMITHSAKAWNKADVQAAVAAYVNKEISALTDEDYNAYVKSEAFPSRADKDMQLSYEKDYLASFWTFDYNSTDGLKNYIKSQYDENGYVTGISGTGYGDSCLVVDYSTQITKSPNQPGTDESGKKLTYDMDTGQREVDYVLYPTAIRSQGESTTEGASTTTTVYIEDTLPAGLEYILNSAYYGGEYTSNGGGRAGTVTGGKQLQPTITENADGTTTLLFTLEDVTITAEEITRLEPIYYSCLIGTPDNEETDVVNQQQLVNSVKIWSADEQIRDFVATNGNYAEQSILISKNKGVSFSKTSDQKIVDVGDEMGFTIHHGNNSSNSMDVVDIDFLPHNEDGRGTQITGQVIVSELTIQSKDLIKGFKLYYTTDTAKRNTTAAYYKASDFTKANGWTEMEVDADTGAVKLPDTTHVIVAVAAVGTLPPNSTLKMHISFEVPDGMLVGLLGPSGCGKSTTLNMICGLETPTEGKILFGEDDVTALPPELRGVGMVFQNYALYPHLTVMQNILFPLENLKGKDRPSRQEMRQRALETAKLVQIEELLERKPKELSGGQQQRVAIARTLAPEPSVLFMDEPLSNLDAKLRLEMRYELQRLHLETGSTFVYVTHDQMEAMTLATQICLIDNGVLQQYDAPLTVYHQPSNLFVADFVGNPSINFVEASGEQQEDGSVALTLFRNRRARFRPARPLDLKSWFQARDREAQERAELRRKQAADKNYVEKGNKDEVFRYHIAKVVEEDDSLQEEPVLTNQDLVLGVRPEFLDIEDSGSLDGEIYGAMPTGMESTIKVRVDDFLLTGVVFGSTLFSLGAKVRLNISSDNIMLFDRQSGRCITQGSLEFLQV